MKEINITSEWKIKTDFPIIVAGPCSAETEKQLFSTAEAMQHISQIDLFRAGIWKPRTRPGDFEGKGEEAVRWLVDVKEKYGFAVCTEVATPKHVEVCLKHGVDALWIGSRTVVSPLAISEISAALQGVDTSVMVKNPMNPDINLWIGALERFYNVGIKRLAAVHRGFFTYNETHFRNDPVWQIPFELKRRIPKLPLICDVSHISGNSKLIADVSQWALDLEMDGLMIETHIEPRQALTDAKQQLTPNELKELLNNLQIKKTNKQTPQKVLSRMRQDIDNVDDQLLQQLGRRMEIIRQMGEYKQEHNMTILQMERWKKVLDERIDKGLGLGIKKEFLFKLLQLIHQESIRIQSEINSKKNL